MPQASSAEHQLKAFPPRDEADQLSTAAGQRRRNPFRNKVLVGMTYRTELQASGAAGMQRNGIDLDSATLELPRGQGDNISNHLLNREELRNLRKSKEIGRVSMCSRSVAADICWSMRCGASSMKGRKSISLNYAKVLTIC